MNTSNFSQDSAQEPSAPQRFHSPELSAPSESVARNKKPRSGAAGRRWAIGVIIIYTAFALGTLGVVGFTMTQKVDLVSENYYKREVEFQRRIDAANRAASTKDVPRWRVVRDASGARLEISFPPSMLALMQGQNGENGSVSGTLTLFRRSTLGEDRTTPLSPDADGVQRIDLSGLRAGVWNIQMEWQINGQDYYKESDIHL
jgi:hypothetical protein